MSVKLLTFLFCLCYVCCSCNIYSFINMKYTHEPIVRDEPDKLSMAIIIEGDSMFYLCSSHNSILYKRSSRKIHKICTCELSNPELNDIILSTKVRGGVLPSHQYIVIYDSIFISNYIIPLFKEEKRKIIEYTLLNANNSTFKNIIDFENKTIINDDAFYYQIKSSKIISVFISDLKWLKSIVPQDKWIYNKDYYNEDASVFLLIPLLENNDPAGSDTNR